MTPRMASRFQRFLLPGFAFKAVVIGGGYATGRELAEFFLPSGPWGGIAAMLLATVVWSAVCAATFLFARRYQARDYLTFVRALLGPAWIVFEAAYILFVVLILAVFGAAAGALAEATLGAPRIAGTLALMAAIALVVAFGNTSVERLFKYVSFLLYGVYVSLPLCSRAARVQCTPSTSASAMPGIAVIKCLCPARRASPLRSRYWRVACCSPSVSASLP